MNRIALRSSLRLRAALVAALALAAATLAALPAAEAGSWLKVARAATRHGDAAPVGLPTLAQARESFLAQRYAEAYGRFAALADRGDAVAASMALAMVTTGPALFAGDWSATPGQLRRWSALALQHTEQRSAQIAGGDRRE